MASCAISRSRPKGGHCDFAARNETEIALLQYLHRTLDGRVSFERVVSGLGIKNVYAFCKDDRKMEEPAWLAERLAKEDPNAVIGQCGEDGSSEICAETMRIFSAAYGAEAGNIALKIFGHGRHLSWWRHRSEDSEDTEGRAVHGSLPG